jgi:hypothetical protein
MTAGGGPPLPPPPGLASPAPEPETPAPKKRRFLAAALALLLIVGGGAASAAFFLLRGSGPPLLARVPADAPIVVVANLDPPASQQAELLRMASQFPALGGTEDLRAKLEEGLNGSLGDVGLTVDDLNWVGSEAVFTVEIPLLGDPVMTLLIESDDDGAASDVVDAIRDGSGAEWVTSSHEGVRIEGGGDTYFAVFDGALVMSSTKSGVQRIIDTSRDERDDVLSSAVFQEITAELPEERLGMMFVNAGPFLGSLEEQLTILSPEEPIDFGPFGAMGASLSAEPEGLAIDVVSLLDEGAMTSEERDVLNEPDHENPLAGLLPADSFMAALYQHMDTGLEASLEAMTLTDPELAKELATLGITGKDGLLSIPSGDLALEVSPGRELMPGGALLVGVTDSRRAQEILDRLMPQLPLGSSSLAGRPGGTKVRWVVEEHRGVRIAYAKSGADLPLAYAVVGDAAVVATSPDQIMDIVDVGLDGGGLGESQEFEAAFEGVPGSEQRFLLDVARFLSYVKDVMGPGVWIESDFENLEPITQIVIGEGGDATGTKARILIRIPGG